MESSQLWSKTASDSLEGLNETDHTQFIQYDLGNLPYNERALFTESALRKIWQRNEKHTMDTFIVIDEAHNLVPAHTENIWQQRTMEWINRIAAEGRKYGLKLLVVSQRPSKIHANTLDNCQNFFILKLMNRDDLEHLSRLSSDVSISLLSRISTLQPHEALLFGRICNPVMARVGRRRLR